MNIYNTYFSLKESYLEKFPDLLDDYVVEIDEKVELQDELDEEWEKVPQILLVLNLIAQANIRKRLAERIIELNFKTDEDLK